MYSEIYVPHAHDVILWRVARLDEMPVPRPASALGWFISQAPAAVVLTGVCFF